MILLFCFLVSDLQTSCVKLALENIIRKIHRLLHRFDESQVMIQGRFCGKVSLKVKEEH